MPTQLLLRNSMRKTTLYLGNMKWEQMRSDKPFSAFAAPFSSTFWRKSLRLANTLMRSKV